MTGTVNDFSTSSVTIEIATSGDNWNILSNGMVQTASGPAIRQTQASTGSAIDIAGTVAAYGELETGVYLSGFDWSLNIARTGVLSGFNGLYVDGGEFLKSTSHITNAGKITAGDGAGVTLATSYIVTLTNSGRISGLTGLELDSGLNYVTNTRTGVIAGSDVAIMSSPLGADYLFDFTNKGLVKSAHTAFLGSAADEHLVNEGRIVGDIRLGAGNDTVDTSARGADIDGRILGGLGDDLLSVHSAATRLTEKAGQGNDSIVSTVSYVLSANVENLRLLGTRDMSGTGNGLSNQLLGGDGNDTLKGLGGADFLSGGDGDDRLIGGAGKDIFEFYTGKGRDRIVDFTNGVDRIDLHDWTGVDSLAAVKAHMTVSGNDLVIRMGADSLTIEHTARAEIDLSDFIF
jgi:Ca2+-binding RTX toxin-like protein